MKKILSFLILSAILILNIGVSSAQRFDDVLNKSSESIQNQVDIAPVAVQGGGEGIKNYLIFIGQKILLPVSIIIALVIVIVGFYEIFFSEKDDAQKKGVKFITRGVIGIVLMSSAGYIGKTLVGETGGGGTINTFSGTNIAQELYSYIAYPFIKLAMFLVVGILFILLFIHAFRFVVTPSDDIKKHSQKIVIWNTVGILLILGTKNIVEVIYGSVDQVAANPGTSLGDVGSGILQSKNLIIAYAGINWAMGFAAFLTLLIVMYQTYLMLTKPDDAETHKKLRRNFVYIFIGILIIGGGYMVTNFFIIK